MSRRLDPLAITLIVIDVVLIGVLVFLIATAPDRSGDDVPPDDVTSAGNSGTGSTQAVTAPADALDISEFVAPSGNIWCNITDDAATCQIDTIEYAPPSIPDCADNDLAGRVLRVTAERAEYPCPESGIDGPPPADREVLDYDQATVVGDFMCQSSEAGIRCTNLSAGRWFSVRRAEAEVTTN